MKDEFFSDLYILTKLDEEKRRSKRKSKRKSKRRKASRRKSTRSHKRSYRKSKSIRRHRSTKRSSSFSFGGDFPTPNHAEFTSKLLSLVGEDRVVDQKIKVGPKDVLFIIDMQNDFVDLPYDDQKTGKLSAPESSQIIDGIVGLVDKFKDSLIIATKDYHPEGHCSFRNPDPSDSSGPSGSFPPHCVIGTNGAKIVEPIYKAIQFKSNAYIAFKGFHPQNDSFSALQYKDPNKFYNKFYDKRYKSVGCSSKLDVGWTGSFVVKISDYQYKKDFDKEYNPSQDEFDRLIQDCTSLDDDNSYLNRKTSCKLKHIEDLLGEKKIDKTSNIFICGLVGDICVFDTAINLVETGYENVYIVLDLTRMVYIPGKEYLASPEEYARRLADYPTIKLIMSENIIQL